MRWDGRHFPHPVLRPANDDYPAGRFNVLVRPVPGGSTAYRLRLQVELKSPFLQQLIAEGAARMILHVECPRTRWRHVATLSDGLDLILSVDEVRGAVELSPMVVAVADIPKFTSDEFHPDYENQPFAVQRGDVLALAPAMEFVADPLWDPLKQVRSIFQVAPNPEPNAPPLDISLSGERIVLLLSPAAFDLYRRLSGSVRHHRILTGLVILPALVAVVEAVRRGDEPEEWRTRRWRRLLASKLEGVPAESSSLTVAHRLIGHPVPEALNDLNNLMQRIGE